MKKSGYDKYFQKRKEVMNKKSKKKLTAQNVSLALAGCILAGGSGWYLYVGDQGANKLFDRVEISLLGEANAAPAETAETKDKASEKISSTAATEKAAPKKSWTDEEINLFSKLESRKQQLDARESELSKLEEELQKQKDVLEKRLAELEEVRGKISSKLDEKVKIDQQKVESLVSVFANMKPASAAKVVEGINEDLAVEVLAHMKNKNAAEILNLMDADKAKRMAEKYAGYREPASK